MNVEMVERRAVDHLRKKFLTYDRIMVWVTLAGILYVVMSFYARANPLPERVSEVENKLLVHCAAQEQREKDRDARLVRIENKLDGINEKLGQ